MFQYPENKADKKRYCNKEYESELHVDNKGHNDPTDDDERCFHHNAQSHKNGVLDLSDIIGKPCHKGWSRILAKMYKRKRLDFPKKPIAKIIAKTCTRMRGKKRIKHSGDK